jgi:hypothetical protein
LLTKKISGDPTYTEVSPSSKKKSKQMANPYHPPLRGGSQGNLGLVSSYLAYDRVSPGVPFNRPVNPVLPDLTGKTGPQIATARELHAKTSEAFKTCNLIERTTIQQINTAVNQGCLTDLIDNNTGLLEGPVLPHIMKQLFETYGAITPQTLTAAKATLESTIYNHSKPIVNIFTAINDCANMAEVVEAAETPTQLININIRLIIITRSTIFSSDIRKWNSKPEVDRTWPAFKVHFREAQRDIKRSQPTVTTNSLGFHGQANAVAIIDQVIQRLTTSRDPETAMSAETIAEQQMQQQLSEMANATQQNQSMMEQMQSLMSTISTLQTQVNNNGQTHGRNDGGRGHRSERAGADVDTVVND